MQTLDNFLNSEFSLMVYRDEQLVFSSTDSDLNPLRQCLSDNAFLSGVLIFDRYVGRAAALLMTFLKPSRVFAGVISQAGAAALDEHTIPYEAREQVKYLMGVASDGMCSWEKLSLGKSAEEFLEALQQAEDGSANKD